MTVWQLQRRPGVEAVSVTAIGLDGSMETRTLHVGLGLEKAEEISLPAGARAIKIGRPVRVRVDLGQIRKVRPTALQARRPDWRDNSNLWLRWEYWRAACGARRAYRRNQLR